MSATARVMSHRLHSRHQALWQRPRVLLIAAVLLSAFAVIYAKHWNRKVYAELQQLQTQRNQLNVEWGQLQLEQSAWATNSRVEAIARDRLGMMEPAPDQVTVLRP